MNQAQTIAAKDAEIGLLKADKYTDQKLSEVTAYLMGQIKDLSNEVRANKDEQAGVNMQQAVYNATNTAAISCLQNQVAALQGPPGAPGWRGGSPCLLGRHERHVQRPWAALQEVRHRHAGGIRGLRLRLLAP